MSKIKSSPNLRVLGAIICVIVFNEAFAAESVEFNSATAPPSKFAVERAKKKGVELKPKLGTPLRGLLHTPSGTGPFPAVVLLHGCRGLEPYHSTWAKKLVEWGYVVLQVDSFGPRGVTERCTEHGIELEKIGEIVFDTYGALDYLHSHQDVDETRIAVMGWPKYAVLGSVLTEGVSQVLGTKFQTAVAFYPECHKTASGDFYTPVLVLIGGKDDWVSVSECTSMAERGASRSSPISLEIYPQAYHAFDNPELTDLWYYEEAANPGKQPPRGATLGYNRSAHKGAEEKVKQFLATTFQ
jgi:dienelactone hydrolase